MRNPIITATRWLCGQPGRGADLAAAEELYRQAELGRLCERVQLELEVVYPAAPNATGALALRETLAQLAYRAVGDADARLVWPPVFDLPHVPGGGYRVRLAELDGLPIYAGGAISVERESEPPPRFLRRVQ